MLAGHPLGFIAAEAGFLQQLDEFLRVANLAIQATGKSLFGPDSHWGINFHQRIRDALETAIVRHSFGFFRTQKL